MFVPMFNRCPNAQALPEIKKTPPRTQWEKKPLQQHEVHLPQKKLPLGHPNFGRKKLVGRGLHARNPICSTNFKNLGLGSAFVSASATISSVCLYTTSISHDSP